MADHEKLYTPAQGKTYSLFVEGEGPERYYSDIRRLADLFLQHCPDEKKLLGLIQKGGKRRFSLGLKATGADREMLRFIKDTLKQSMSPYTRNVSHHLKTLPLAKRLDETLATTEEKYHLYMLEIELVNRIYREAFKQSEYKFALIAHCLRDYKPGCRSEMGDIEAVCKRCTEECFVHLGSVLLEKYGIKAYISVEIEQEKLFAKLKREHPSIGALGSPASRSLPWG